MLLFRTKEMKLGLISIGIILSMLNTEVLTQNGWLELAVDRTVIPHYCELQCNPCWKPVAEADYPGTEEGVEPAQTRWLIPGLGGGEWHPMPVFLPGEFVAGRGGYIPLGNCWESVRRVFENAYLITDRRLRNEWASKMEKEAE